MQIVGEEETRFVICSPEIWTRELDWIGGRRKITAKKQKPVKPITMLSISAGLRDAR